MDDGKTVKQRRCAVEGCLRPIRCRGWCWFHYIRWYHKGDPGGLEPNFVNLTLDDRDGIKRLLLSRRTFNERGCWIYTGVITDAGYGRKTIGNRLYLVHRLSAWIWKGLDLRNRDHEALHDCDTPACFNPAHLIVGDQSKNICDMVLRGRGHTNKITPDIVRQIRADTESASVLAKKYALTPQTIRDIKKRRTWKNIT